MTGYGRGGAREGQWALALEVKTVNHRNFELMAKLPAGLWELEPRIRQGLREVISRGRAEVYLHWLTPLSGIREPVVDMNLAKGYIQALRVAGRKLGLKGELDLPLAIGLPEVVRIEERPLRMVLIGPLVMRALNQALRGLVNMRRNEGRRLTADMQQRLSNVRRLTQAVRRLFFSRKKKQTTTLRKRLEGLFKAGNQEGKQIAREACGQYLRADITEEIVRLAAHGAQFGQLMRNREPVGRRMDFLIQEMNREINTVGAKAGDAVIAHHVVDIKEELERIREQVQNIE